MKEATIRFRCSNELKAKLELMAAAKEQTLSDFVRAQILEIASAKKAQTSGMFMANDEPRYLDNPVGRRSPRQKKERAG